MGEKNSVINGIEELIKEVEDEIERSKGIMKELDTETNGIREDSRKILALIQQKLGEC